MRKPFFDTGGPEFDDEDCFTTTESPVEARIHVHHLATIRLGKAALVAAIETGAVLHDQRFQRGDGFDDWVNTQLGLSLDEAECYIRFYEASGVRTEQLSPVVEVKLARVLELLGQLNAGFPGRDASSRLSGPANEAAFAQREVRTRPFALPETHRTAPLFAPETATSALEPS